MIAATATVVLITGTLFLTFGLSVVVCAEQKILCRPYSSSGVECRQRTTMVLQYPLLSSHWLYAPISQTLPASAR